ncbi:MAG: amidohydrolase family protein, partial [Terriglobales bacterium]
MGDCPATADRLVSVAEFDRALGAVDRRKMGGTTIVFSLKSILGIVTGLGVFVLLSFISSQAAAQSKRIVIAAGAVLDGKGHVLRDVRIVIEESKIVAVVPVADSKSASKVEPVDYDLRGLTVLPGWIDAHVHITWSFGPDGKNAGQGGTTPEAAYAAASNAWLTLMAGFTTVQSVGSLADVPLRDAIAKGSIPGPRILTAVEPLFGQGEKTG